MAALTRDELVGILAEIIHAARARLPEARTADGLKAAEMLARMCGWNEPEQVNVQSVEVKVEPTSSGLRQMVRGVRWHFNGVPVANPDKDECCVGCKLGPIAPAYPAH